MFEVVTIGQLYWNIFDPTNDSNPGTKCLCLIYYIQLQVQCSWL